MTNTTTTLNAFSTPTTVLALLGALRDYFDNMYGEERRYAFDLRALLQGLVGATAPTALTEEAFELLARTHRTGRRPSHVPADVVEFASVAPYSAVLALITRALEG